MKEIDNKHKIYAVTLRGTAVNIILMVLKFAAGIIGHSSAIIADAVHSMSDLLTDWIVLVSVKWSNKPSDNDHDYGHGKIETLATAIVGLILMIVGFLICYHGMKTMIQSFQGIPLERPGYIALIAAVVSIILKEWAYRFTIRTARETKAPIMAANAWHHRSDALSSIGTSIGICGAIFLGERWRVLDPITSIIVSIFIMKVAFELIAHAVSELLETSLPEEVEREIVSIASDEQGVSDIHHLMTRKIGKRVAIEMHIRVAPDMTVSQAHDHATHIEQNLRKRFGADSHVGIHIEPEK